jgi:protein-S-isoprenylcysteine O-methyltransferase Ste14
MMLSLPGFIIVGCWIVFIVYWWVSAQAVKTTVERRSFASSLSYRIPLIGGILLANNDESGIWGTRLLPHTMVTAWGGAAICVAGLAFTIWARAVLAGNWSSDVRFKQGHELVKTGPYNFVRHPIYTGILLMCLGPVIKAGRLNSWLGLLLIGIGLWIKLKQEEEIMRQHFPEYDDYRKRVKALVPFVM